MKELVYLIIAIIVIAATVWTMTSAPCSTFRYSNTKDIPARCLGEYTR